MLQRSIYPVLRPDAGIEPKLMRTDFHLPPIASRVAVVLISLLLLTSSPLSAQRYNISYAPNSQEGLLLQLIEQLEGPAKIQQMELFLTRFPTHPSVNWIYATLQDFYTQNNEIDKALVAGEKLFSLNPDDLEAAVNNQKLAEKKNDSVLVQKWKDLSTAAAQKLVGSPKPFYIPQEEWNKRLAYAGGLINQADYLLYKQAIESEKPSEKIKYFDELLAKAPNSVYIAQGYPMLMQACRAMGSNDRALSIAEKILTKDADNEEALLMIAQVHLDRRSNYPRVITVANRILNLGQISKKPEHFTADEWSKRRTFYSGAAFTILGNAYVFQNNFEMADKSFRAALPFIKGNPQAESSAYFYIGWSNYYLEKYKEAAGFFKLCISGQGPFSQQANKQLDGMKRERRYLED